MTTLGELARSRHECVWAGTLLPAMHRLVSHFQVRQGKSKCSVEDDNVLLVDIMEEFVGKGMRRQESHKEAGSVTH